MLADLRASGWAYADEPALARFLLTAQVNDFDPAAIGAALFEVGLIPEFELLAQPERAPARLSRNRECVARITGSTRSERARALDLGLRDPAFCKQLGEYFARAGVANPRDWTHRIVKDRANWPLAFHRWAFEDGGIAPDSIFIGDLELPDLPTVKGDEADPKLAEPIGQRILPISQTGLKKFGVSFRVDPVPAKVEGLSRFVAEVVSRDNGPTGLRRRKAAWTRASTHSPRSPSPPQQDRLGRRLALRAGLRRDRGRRTHPAGRRPARAAPATAGGRRAGRAERERSLLRANRRGGRGRAASNGRCPARPA